jgi:hypothetical protein
MKTIEITRKPIELDKFKKRTALEQDCSIFIDYDCLVTENGIPKILYKKLQNGDTQTLRQSVKNIKYQQNTRTTGLKTPSRIFGFSPRNVIRNDFCSSTSLSHESPIENKIVCNFGNIISKLYEQYFPMVYNKHIEEVNKKVLDEWKIEDTPFTSGIINKNNPLKYHFDGGNIKGVLSNMVVFKHKTSGGYLACPEFDVLFKVEDNTCILFDGQDILHGVTPIQSLSKESYRYSVVYYTLQQMWNCLPYNDEVKRARSNHLKREMNRSNGNVSENELQFDKVV